MTRKIIATAHDLVLVNPFAKNGGKPGRKCEQGRIGAKCHALPSHFNGTRKIIMRALKTQIALAVCICGMGCAQIPVYSTSSEKNMGETISPRRYYLPKGILVIKIARGSEEKSSKEEPVKIEVTTKMIADTESKYYLYRDHSNWYEDKYVIEVGQNGLLTSVNTTDTFKGAEIAKAVSEIGAKIAQLAAGAKEEPTAAPPECSKFSLNIEIDPYKNNADDINQEFFNNNDCIHNINVAYENLTDHITSLDGTRKPRNAEGATVTEQGANPANPEGTSKPTNAQATTVTKGIVYRTMRPFPIVIKSRDGKQSFQSFYVEIPDRAYETFVVDRGYFVDRVVNLTFTNGILTKDDITYPSEILGFLSIPLEILNGISQAITGRFDTRTTELTKEKAYLDALKQRNEALEMQRNP